MQLGASGISTMTYTDLLLAGDNSSEIDVRTITYTDMVLYIGFHLHSGRQKKVKIHILLQNIFQKFGNMIEEPMGAEVHFTSWHFLLYIVFAVN